VLATSLTEPGLSTPESSTYTGERANELSVLRPEAATNAAMAAARVRGRNERDFMYLS